MFNGCNSTMLFGSATNLPAGQAGLMERDLCKTLNFVFLSDSEESLISEILNVKILHYVQKDSLLRFYKGLSL